MIETMSELFSIAHVWIKAVHLIAVISWMAGLLYLPRLFVYHCSAQTGSDKSETFKVMERRLLYAIMNPWFSWISSCHGRSPSNRCRMESNGRAHLPFPCLCPAYAAKIR